MTLARGAAAVAWVATGRGRVPANRAVASGRRAGLRATRTKSRSSGSGQSLLACGGMAASVVTLDAYLLHQPPEDDVVTEVIVRHIGRCPAMAGVVRSDGVDGRDGFIGRRECKQPAAGREDPPEAGVLRDDGPARREVCR